MSSTPAVATAPSNVIRVLAYCAIYFLWGASFLAIRVIVAAAPPLRAAGVRFLSAGLILFLWAVLRGSQLPNAREWRSALFLGVGMFACNYGPLFWAEQRVDSGIAAIVSALIPVWIAVFESMRSRSRISASLIIGTACGVAGVVALSLTPGDVSGPIELLPLAALLLEHSRGRWAQSGRNGCPSPHPSPWPRAFR